MIWSSGWFWVVVGVALMLAEVLLPGFILLGFGVGGVLVGLLVWAHLLGGSLPLVLLVFAILSGVAWAVLRRVFGLRGTPAKIWDRDINDN